MKKEKNSYKKLYGKKSNKMLIGIWVTTGCNLKCKYCYEGTDKKCENMTVKVADGILEFIKNIYEENSQEPLIVEFHGGEPLLNYSMIQYLISKIEKIFFNVLFGITTNGILLTKDMMDYLLPKMTYGFSLSIDGNESSNDINRIDYGGNGTYKRVSKKIPELLKRKETIRARMTYTPETVEHLSANIIYLIECGFKNIVSAPDYFSNNWSREKIDVLLNQMYEIKKYYQKNLSDLKQIRISILEDRFKEKGICQGGKLNFHILPNGNIYPCSYGVGNEELLIGNVIKNGLIKSKIYKLEKINITDVETCRGCEDYSACICSRCKIFNKVLMGDFFQPVPIICAIEHVKQKFWGNSSK